MKIFFSKRKIAIIISIIVILLIAGICTSIYYVSKNNMKTTELVSNDNSFKLTVPSKIKFERKESDTLDIFSEKDEMIISSTVIKKEKEINLSDAVYLEMAGLHNTKQQLDNLSGLENISIQNSEACKYSYNYFDEKYNDFFYTEIVWIKTEKNIYVLDCEVITKNQEKYKPLFTEIISSFEEINVSMGT